MTINLTKEQYDELISLSDGDVIEVDYKGIPGFITPDEYGNIEYKGRRFTFNFYCPAEARIHVEAKAEEQTEQTQQEENEEAEIIGADYEPKKMHLYDVKTSGKHPVHLIDGGNVLTEDEGCFGAGDMGWFWLNSREYDYFKSKCHKMKVDR